MKLQTHMIQLGMEVANRANVVHNEFNVVLEYNGGKTK